MNYNQTIYACFIGYIVQAIVNNFAPLLFLTFQAQYTIFFSLFGFGSWKALALVRALVPGCFGDDLRKGILIAVAFPILLVLGILALRSRCVGAN